ncbi:hypothetical protein D3C79_733740 [compost metagenome]
MLADRAHVVGRAQSQAGPGALGNHVQHDVEDFGAIGRSALGDQVVHDEKRNAGGNDREGCEDAAVAIAEPQRCKHHGDDQCQHRATALAEHHKRPQAGQRHQPAELHAAMTRHFVQQQQCSRAHHVGTQDGVRDLADARQPRHQAIALKTVESDDRHQRGQAEQCAADQQQATHPRVTELSQQRKRHEEYQDVEQPLAFACHLFGGRPAQADGTPAQQQQHTGPQCRLTPPGLGQHLPRRPRQNQRRQPQEDHNPLLIDLVARRKSDCTQEPDQTKSQPGACPAFLIQHPSPR